MLGSAYKIGKILLLNAALPVRNFSLNLLTSLLFRLRPVRLPSSFGQGKGLGDGHGGMVKGKANDGGECIVFSKDRAFQLHALLSSYFEKVRFPMLVHVLYVSSTRSHEKAYKELIPLFSEKPVLFYRQTDTYSFRKDFLRLLDSVRNDSVLFLVDDVVFTEDVDLLDFIKFNTKHFVPTLRMGLNLRRCYTMQQDQPLPRWSPGNGEDANKVYWNWGEGAYDWGYPLSLDGHLFSTWEVIVMSRLSRFRGPNGLEHTLQRFRRLFKGREGVCYRKSKIMNLAINKVQQENENICGNIHQDFLKGQWERGFQMDYRQFYGFLNESAHQEVPISFIRRP